MFLSSFVGSLKCLRSLEKELIIFVDNRLISNWAEGLFRSRGTDVAGTHRNLWQCMLGDATLIDDLTMKKFLNKIDKIAGKYIRIFVLSFVIAIIILME